MSDKQNAIIRLVVAATCDGVRLDRFVAGAATDLSRQRIKALIQAGNATVDAVLCTEANRKVRAGQTVTLALPAPEPMNVAGEPIPLDVVYEDDDLIVVDKPAGLVTHPAPGHAAGTLVNALIAHAGCGLSGIGGVMRPGIVHRLDKDTSGLIVVAKSDMAHRGLAEQFAAHGTDGRMERSYTAIAWGGFDRPKGTINAALGRSATNRRKIAVVDAAMGRHAVTRYQVEERFSIAGNVVACRLRLVLETGRTHQIRVHLAAIQHPLLGDALYGAGFKSSATHLPLAAQAALKRLGRQALHAVCLGFEHPRTGARLRFESELPRDIAELLEALRAGCRSE